jgi:hypothetical protein
VSIPNVVATQQVARQLREHRLATQSGDDVLQFYAVLWYAYVWLSKEFGDFLVPCGPDAHLTDIGDVEMVDQVDLSANGFISKAQRKANKSRDKRKAAAVMARLENLGHDFSCSLCPGKFNRNGLVNHLYT